MDTDPAERDGLKLEELTLSPREERTGREPERGEIETNVPPLPNPLLHSAEEREKAAEKIRVHPCSSVVDFLTRVFGSVNFQNHH